MAKVIVVSDDEIRMQQITALITQAGSHFVQVARAQPARALAHPGVLQSVDVLILDAPDFTPDVLDQLRVRLDEQRETRCLLLTDAPDAETLMRAMRAGVQCVLPWPLVAHDFIDELHRATGRAAGMKRGEGRVLSFLSCKGGGGTTFVAANLGYALAARRDKRVLLVDLNQQYGDAGFLVTDKPAPASLSDIAQQIDRLDAALLDACILHAHPNFDVIVGAGDPVRGAELKASHLERILALVRPQYDLILFDVGQTINPASILVLDQSELIYAVLQLHLPYLRAGQRMLGILHSLGYRKDALRMVVNQHDKHVPISLATLEESFGMSAAHVLPNDGTTARDAANQGVPVLQLAGNSAIARSLMQMTDALYPAMVPKKEPLLRRVLNAGTRTGGIVVEKHA